MPDDKPQLDYLDYTSIRFPSDKLTIGTLRKLEPDKFDVQGLLFRGKGPYSEDNDGGSWEMVQEIMCAERILAHVAYEQAIGRDARKASWNPLRSGRLLRGVDGTVPSLRTRRRGKARCRTHQKH